MKEFISLAGVAEAVADCHPNNPNLVPLTEWQVRRGMKEQQLTGNYSLVIMLPHQGDHECAIVFNEGDDDAQVDYYTYSGARGVMNAATRVIGAG